MTLPRTLHVRGAAASVLAAALLLAAVPARPAAEPSGPSGAPVATTARFSFHSDLAANLNDALVVAGTARMRGEPELFGRASEEGAEGGVEERCFAGLPAALRSGWHRAVDHYAEVVVPAGGWRDRPQFRLRLELVGIGGEEEPAERITRALRQAAAPAYEACRWPAQDAENRRWIEHLVPRLERHGEAIADRLAAWYGMALHGLPMRVDVVAAAPPLGANTIWLSPAGGHILISAATPEELALETVFHEASHTLMRRGDPVQEALRAAAGELDVPLPRDLWHVLLFYTTGQAVLRTLEQAGEPGYTPYLYSFERFGRGPWGLHRQAVERAWPAYLDGEAGLAEAARDLVRTDRELAADEEPASGGDPGRRGDG